MLSKTLTAILKEYGATDTLNSMVLALMNVDERQAADVLAVYLDSIDAIVDGVAADLGMEPI